MKYRKKPVVIEAVQWNSGKNSLLKIQALAWNSTRDVTRNEDGTLTIKTLEGDHTAIKGDFIIKGVKGELYPCKPDIFEMTYERCEEGDVGTCKQSTK
jgi:hypothetical protein